MGIKSDIIQLSAVGIPKVNPREFGELLRHHLINYLDAAIREPEMSVWTWHWNGRGIVARSADTESHLPFSRHGREIKSALGDLISSCPRFCEGVGERQSGREQMRKLRRQVVGG